jgi:hypothetical protein
MKQGAFILIALLLMPGFARASEHVSLNSQVFVERTVLDGKGRQVTVLAEPKTVLPGDNLVFLLRYTVASETPATGFAVTNPLPPAISFRETKGRAALFSVDVTHIRWTFGQSLPAGSTGKLSFRGTVR